MDGKLEKVSMNGVIKNLVVDSKVERIVAIGVVFDDGQSGNNQQKKPDHDPHTK